MCHLLDLPRQASTRQIFIALCNAEELTTHRFRNGEKPFYNELKNNAALLFTFAERTTEVWQKVLLLAQLDMCSIDLTSIRDKHKDAINNVSLHKGSIRNHLLRLLSCTVDCKLEQNDAISIRNALELRRSIAAKCWENRPTVLKQLNGIGDGSLKTLLSAGINSLEKLGQTDPRELERIFKRNPPFGNNVLKDLATLPKLSLKVALDRCNRSPDGVQLVFKIRLGCENKPRDKKGGQAQYINFFADTIDGLMLDFRRQSIRRILEEKEFVLQLNLVAYTEQVRFTLTCEELGKESYTMTERTLICQSRARSK